MLADGAKTTAFTYLGEKITQHCVDMLNLMALANATKRDVRAGYLDQLLTLQRAGIAAVRVGGFTETGAMGGLPEVDVAAVLEDEVRRALGTFGVGLDARVDGCGGGRGPGHRGSRDGKAGSQGREDRNKEVSHFGHDGFPTPASRSQT